jgi:hypothetical protein
VRPSAEQAVKVPLQQPFQGSGDSAKCDGNSFSSIFPVFTSFYQFLPAFHLIFSTLNLRRRPASE